MSRFTSRFLGVALILGGVRGFSLAQNAARPIPPPHPMGQQTSNLEVDGSLPTHNQVDFAAEILESRHQQAKRMFEQMQLQADTEKLSALTREFEAQVSHNALAVELLKKADAIEKLAKKVQLELKD